MRLEPRTQTPVLLGLLAPVAAGIAALAIAAIPLAWAGADIGRAFALMFQGALGTGLALTETLTRSTPLIFTGLAAAVAFRAKLWNIGAEGQLYMGALAAIAVSMALGPADPFGEADPSSLGAQAWFMIPASLAAGAVAGAVMMLGPTVLKLNFGVDEVVTTLLLNFVVLLFVSWMLEGPMQDPMGMGWPQTIAVAEAAELPKLVPRTRLHVGLVIGIGFALLIWLLIARSVWGYRVRAVGLNPRAAAFAGIPVWRVMLTVGALSGALAGLAGAVEVAGAKGYVTSDLSPGFGYTGIVVAMLAQLNPLGVVASALFLSAVFVGADSMSRELGVSSYLANFIVATALLTMLIAGLFTRFRLRFGRAG
ncbi:MAG: ABC transporter permease [Alphaproteobacteria bacterium]